MNHIEDVFRDSYSGIGANKFLLPHAIAEVHYIIKRLHSIIRYSHDDIACIQYLVVVEFCFLFLMVMIVKYLPVVVFTAELVCHQTLRTLYALIQVS